MSVKDVSPPKPKELKENMKDVLSSLGYKLEKIDLAELEGYIMALGFQSMMEKSNITIPPFLVNPSSLFSLD